MITVQKRTHCLDLLRIVACFLVIVNHSVSSVFLWRSPDDPIWFQAVISFFVSKIAVPLFFMISGYLMLNKQDTWKKILLRIARIVLSLLVLNSCYALIHGIQDYPNTSKIIVLKETFSVFQNPPFQGLWYLYAYVGILLMLPYLQKLAAKMKKNDYHIFFFISAFFVGLLPIVQHYHENLMLFQDFQLPLYSGYIAFVFVGGYMARFPVSKSHRSVAICVAVAVGGTVLSILGTYYEFYRQEGQEYLFFDHCTRLPIMAASVAVFCLALWTEIEGWYGFAVSYVGSCTFGIYLVSDFMIRITAPVFYFLSQNTHIMLAMLGYQIAVFLCGLLLTIVLKYIPLVNRIL